MPGGIFWNEASLIYLSSGSGVSCLCVGVRSRVAPFAGAFLMRIGRLPLVMLLYTMTKSTSIVFILGFALFFKLEKKSWSLVMIILMIALGLFLFTYESTQFDVGGFFLILTASFMSGLRWTLAQLLMQKSKMGLENPIDMVYHVQPWMIIAILPFAVAFEGPRVLTNCKTYCFENMGHTSMMALTVCAGALLAFAMEVSEYLVVTWTSSLTLSVACIFKEVTLPATGPHRLSRRVHQVPVGDAARALDTRFDDHLGTT
uniref:Sugar phosphate transporter domain-containing protein n=1 Tax=Timema tahoe TaxID=61484 RepID=A0A7R9P134_9NEOP|nr:unnamed protein product [Timema tahoe]